jgi:hypothetical protein
MFLGLPDPLPVMLDKGMEPRIRIHTKMSRIHNTVFCGGGGEGSGLIFYCKYNNRIVLQTLKGQCHEIFCL